MKEKIMLFFKGMLLGMAMIIPGVSGGTLAISMGIYEKLIDTVSHFFKNFKANLLFCINLGLGVLASIVVCTLILDYAFEQAPVPTTLFFIGLIVGSIPMMLEKAKVKNTLNFKNILFILLGVGIVFGVHFLKGNKDVILGSFSTVQSMKLFGVGFIAAATLVIPGISGSFMLMIMGYYQPLLSVITETIKFNNIVDNLLILIPFGIGIVVGVVVIVKIIEYLLKKYEIKTYYAVIGFLIASIIDVFLKIFSYEANIWQIVIGIITFGVGTYLSLKVLKND